jgi:hypothetical protein
MGNQSKGVFIFIQSGSGVKTNIGINNNNNFIIVLPTVCVCVCMYDDATAVMVVVLLVLVLAGPGQRYICAQSCVRRKNVQARVSVCAATGEGVVSEVVGVVSESGSGNRAG